MCCSYRRAQNSALGCFPSHTADGWEGSHSSPALYCCGEKQGPEAG